jgi:hypothetical protein
LRIEGKTSKSTNQNSKKLQNPTSTQSVEPGLVKFEFWNFPEF